MDSLQNLYFKSPHTSRKNSKTVSTRIRVASLTPAPPPMPSEAKQKPRSGQTTKVSSLFMVIHEFKIEFRFAKIVY